MTEPASAGAMLRAARERQGLHIAALAAAIKVTPRKLDALENDRWTELPDATFTRALAQTVCRSLKIDARPVLELLPPASGVTLEPARRVLNAHFRERPGRDEPSFAHGAIKPMVWAAGLLMLAAVAIYFVPDGMGLGRWRMPVAAAPAASAAAGTASAAPADGAGAAVAAVDSSASAVPSEIVASAASAPTVVDAAPAPAGLVVMAPSAVAAAGSAAVASPAGLLQLRARQASWVQVRDARGLVLLSRTVLPGESVGLDGSLPMQLTIGNAVGMQLAFRGQAVDLAPRTRDNVARFELQ